MASTNKKKPTSVMSEWDSLLRRGSHLAREASGEVYRVEPVDLETFVNSPEYLDQGMWGMSEAQRDFIEKGSDLENGVTFFVMFVGKGGGKNWATGILFLYVIYKLMCMYDPHRYLNHNKSKAITLINVAINATQARKNFFDPLSNILKHAGHKAFRDFGFDPDVDILTTQIVFPGNIEIMSANSRAGGIEGYDILLAMADEVDDSEFHSVEKIINTLRTSSESRFTGKEKVIVISYRRYEGSSGKILDYYNKFKSMTHIYARRYASWEFHPIRTYEDFVNYYKENPEKAACMYGSVDTGSYIDSWIKDPKRIKASMNRKRTWIFDWPLPYQTTEVGSKEWWDSDNHDEWKQSPMSEHSYVDSNDVTHVLDAYDIPIKQHGNPKYKYVLCGDPALGSEANGGDGYGVTLAHREIVRDEQGRKFARPVIDFAFRFTGRMFEEGQVQMNAIEKLILKLKESYGYDIRIFSFDGWNSISLTQWISKRYKGAVVYDRNIVETADYTALRDAIFGEAPPSNGKGDKETNGGIDWPWHPIIYEEARNLKEDRCFTGDTKVRLLSGGTKTFEELVKSNETSFWVYSYNQESGVFVPALATHPRATYETKKLAVVEIDDGNIIKCTPDHKFMTSDGDWVEAQFLKAGDSLKHAHIEYKPIHSTKQHLTYETINNKFTHQWVLDSLSIPRDTVHHVNLNRYDNTPENLTSMSWAEHRQLHLDINARHDVTLNKIIEVKEDSDDVFSLAKKLSCTPELIYSRIKHIGGAREFFGKPKVSIQTLIDSWEFKITQEKLSQKTGLDRETIRNLLNNDWETFKQEQDKRIIFSTYRKGMSLRELARLLGQPWSTFHHTLARYGITQTNLFTHNHKVLTVDIKELDIPIKMYDLTVEGTGNFLLGDSDIIVSNSKSPPKIDHPANGTKDIMDTIAKATRIILYQWPYTDIIAAGTNVQERNIERRVDLGVASREETSKYYDNLYSNSVGLGQWKEETAKSRPITYDELFNE